MHTPGAYTQKTLTLNKAHFIWNVSATLKLFRYIAIKTVHSIFQVLQFSSKFYERSYGPLDIFIQL